jgi:hypothetical protein
MLLNQAAGAESEFDFSDMMNDVETQIQNVQNLIAARNSAAALIDAKKLQDEFKLVEGFFIKRGNSVDAVDNSKLYQEKAISIQNALNASDFEKAAVAANDFSTQCRGACHDKYKPL